MWVYGGVQCTRGPDLVLWPQPFDSVSVGDVAFAVAQPAVASPRINVNGGSRGIPSARNPRFAAREVVAYVRTISQSRTSSLRPFVPLLLTALNHPFLSFFYRFFPLPCVFFYCHSSLEDRRFSKIPASRRFSSSSCDSYVVSKSFHFYISHKCATDGFGRKENAENRFEKHNWTIKVR